MPTFTFTVASWETPLQFINGPSIQEFSQGTYKTPGVTRYPGDGWTAYIREHEYMAGFNEAYVDLRKGPFALRLGKQQIVYGEELGLQTLDQVDSLDFTNYPGFYDIASLEFSDIRIAEWTAKLSYQLPDFDEVGINNSIITGWVSPDFQPTYLPTLGSWINDEPARLPIGDYGNLRRARNKLVYGAVAATTVYGVDLTANFYATPDHIGWFAQAPVATTGTAAWLQPRQLWRVCLSRSCGRICLTSTSSAASRGISSMAGRLPTPSRPSTSLAPHYFTATSSTSPPPILRISRSGLAHSFAAPPNVVKPTRIGEINLTLDGERYVRWSQKFPSMYLLGEWNYKSRSTVITDVYEPSLNHRGHSDGGCIANPVLPEQHLGRRLLWRCATRT